MVMLPPARSSVFSSAASEKAGTHQAKNAIVNTQHIVFLFIINPSCLYTVVLYRVV